MDLHLHFQNGKVAGEGADGLDRFTVAGVYDGESRECAWEKIYPTRPQVFYSGYGEGKGIWGRWTLGKVRGGFHIWPLSEGGPPDLRQLQEDESVEITEGIPVLIPQNQV